MAWWMLPAIATGAGLFGGSRVKEPKPPSYPQNPYRQDYMNQINWGLTGQLSPYQQSMFDEALRRGEKRLQDMQWTMPSGAMPTLSNKLSADMFKEQAGVQEQNKQQALQLAAYLNSLDQQQYQAAMQQYMNEMQNYQNTMGMWGGIAGSGMEGLITGNIMKTLLGGNKDSSTPSHSSFNLGTGVLPGFNLGFGSW